MHIAFATGYFVSSALDYMKLERKDSDFYMMCLCTQQCSTGEILQRIAADELCAVRTHGNQDRQQDAYSESTHHCPCMQLHSQSLSASWLAYLNCCMYDPCIIVDIPSCDAMLHNHASVHTLHT